MANFNYHNSHITSVEWSRFDSTTLATASGDNQARVLRDNTYQCPLR